MARKKKKYKNIKLEQSELTPTAIGIFESKKKSAIGTIVILGIFILDIESILLQTNGLSIYSPALYNYSIVVEYINTNKKERR